MKLQNILFEALSDMANIQPIYHYTTSDAAHKIIDTDTLLGRDPDVGFYDEHLARAKKKAAISFTRERNMDTSYSRDWGNTNDDVDDSELLFDVVFVINRDKLKTRYKLEPFSFDYSMEKMNEAVKDELQKIDYTNVDMGRLLSDPEYRDAFINQNQDAANAIKQGEIDFDVDWDEEEYRRNKGKDTEYEERVIIDKITPLRPYVMDIIYTGPDELLKKKIKKYLGKPTYVGKPRIDFEKSFNNWVYPTPEEFKEMYNKEGKQYFKNYKEFTQAIREGRVVKLDSGYISGGKIKTKKQLLDFIRNNPSSGYTVEGIEATFNRYKKGEKMPLPVMVVFEMGERELISDTINLVITKHLKFTPKVLLIKTSKEYEYDDED
jgi:hypothetical protein